MCWQWTAINATDPPIHRYRQNLVVHAREGAVYLFGKTGDVWTKQFKISDNDGTDSDGFTGIDVNLANDGRFGSGVSLSQVQQRSGASDLYAFGDDGG